MWERPSSGEGVVACFIPESPHRPHRCQNDGRYYMRTVNSFVELPVSMLRQLFYPYAKVDLWIEITASCRATPNATGAWVSYHVEVGNHGTATATDTFLQVTCSEMIEFKRPDRKSVNIDSGWQRVAWLGGELGLLAQRPIHPGMTSAVFEFECLVKSASTISREGTRATPHIGEVTFELAAMATNCKPQGYRVTFVTDDFRLQPSVTRRAEKLE